MTSITSGPPLSSEMRSLLLTAASFRCAGSRQLAALHPELNVPSLMRAAKTAGLLRTHVIEPEGRRVYFVTPSAARLPEVAQRFTTRVSKISAPLARAGWQRAQLWVSMMERGWRVGRSLDALLAVRQHLLRGLDPESDLARGISESPVLQLQREPRCSGCGRPASSPEAVACPRCGLQRGYLPRYRCSNCGAVANRPMGSHDTPPALRAKGVDRCGARMRLVDPIDVDVAFRSTEQPGVSEVMLLLADDPYRSVLRQLEDLPVQLSALDRNTWRVSYPKALRLAFVPTDDSVWDPDRCSWEIAGHNLRRIRALLSPRRRPASNEFAWAKTLRLVDPPGDVPLRRNAGVPWLAA